MSEPVTVVSNRRSHRALAGIGFLLVCFFGWQGLSPHQSLRPTEHSAIGRQLDLNTADRAELAQVPGVGPGLADAIFSHRQDRGPFTDVDELRSVKGIGDKTLDKLRPWFHVAGKPENPPADVELLKRKPVSSQPQPPRGPKMQPGEPPLDLNSASDADLQRLPGVGAVLAARILETRQRARFKSVEDLRQVKGIGTKTFDNLRPFVKVQ